MIPEGRFMQQLVRTLRMGSKIFDSKTARYEATTNTGLETIAQGEVSAKLGVKSKIQMGRIIFDSNHPVDDLLKLKSINNLFVILHEQNISKEELPQDADQLEQFLTKVGEKCDWQTGLTKWRKMSKFDKCSFDQLLIKDESLREVQPKFRISSNRSGSEHKFTSPEICTRMGNVVDNKFGWPIKMKDYDIQIYTNFNDFNMCVTMTLSPISLSCRNIISTGYTTLKASTCYSLLRVADIQPGDIVIDPLAGSGAIPVENMAAWVDKEWCSFSLGSDLTTNVMAKAKINMDVFRSKENIPPSDALIFDSKYSPLKDNSIDVIVSDMPFGLRHGSKAANRFLYPKFMLDWSRITRPKTGRAVLLTQDFKSINIAYDRTKEYWSQKSCNHVKIGNLNCWIYLFHRTDISYHAKSYKTDES